MSIFKLSESIIQDYSNYVYSFINISDTRIRKFVEEQLREKNKLWPEPLVQLNPSYELADTVRDLCLRGSLHPLCEKIFFDSKQNQSVRLYRHQQEAIEIALKGEPFVVTSGTGSGKSLCYFIPIFNSILNNNPQDTKVRAIVVYPMNALVNSQFNALEEISQSFQKRTGNSLPVKFAKYTGQEGEEQRRIIQKDPPHILLTNYVMLELMLLRPEERLFVDRTTAGLEFLVFDELHTYRGRQGADVAMLIRRLRERSGNPDLLCIGTSATMVAKEGIEAHERRKVVAEFAGKLFGIDINPSNIVEEKISPTTNALDMPSVDELRSALNAPIPSNTDEMLKNPLTIWIEFTFGVKKEADGNFRRKTPISIETGAEELSKQTGIDKKVCEECLKQMFLQGSYLKLPDGNPVFAFKLHHFIAQGRSVYATLESSNKRFLTLQGQYYAPGEGNKILYPLVFCRICGQDYYAVLKDERNKEILPWELESESLIDTEVILGFLILNQGEDEGLNWSTEYIPDEWYDANGRLKQTYRESVPQKIWVTPSGKFSEEKIEGAFEVWFQKRPFMLCLNCGEFYTGRDKDDYRKLARLSTEGRNTTTTILLTSALLHAKEGEIRENARKILSFTDNRQDASFQAGHFNDFIQVSLLRSAIWSALEKYGELNYSNIADRVWESIGLNIADIASNRDLDPGSSHAKSVRETFCNLLEYRIYEDLQRGWRIVQPNLEQCGLLRIEYSGLDELCSDETKWENIGWFRSLSPEKRKEIISAILNHFRKKLAINSECLTEVWQQQLRRRVNQHINEKWRFDDKEKLYTASRFLLPGSSRVTNGLSLSDRSLIGRYLRRELNLSVPEYNDLLPKLIDLLCRQGFLFRQTERGVEAVQLEASKIIWKKGDGNPPPPDPIYSRRARSSFYSEVQIKANEFFRDFYKKYALDLKGVEGREHTAQIRYEDRSEREERFRNGTLSCLFCSPTMELGIDIADLQIVHMRNVPPTPANYAQRSGRAGRRGDPALIISYCVAMNPHDQYFFHRREQMVAGSVHAPKIDLDNEDLIRAHIHSIWLAKVGLRLGNSISDILDINLDGCPLNENIKHQIKLSEARIQECIHEAENVLKRDLSLSNWFSREWLEETIRRAPDAFDRAFDRWRELWRIANKKWEEANEILRYPSRNREQQANAERQRREAERQKRLLSNIDTAREESEFYPYRYLASEGFLPGYNFPRLPVRAYIPRGEDGEFISRPRFLALREFGPRNIIYHEGAKYESRYLITPPGGLEERKREAKLCRICGYFLKDPGVDLCENCNSRLDASNSEFIALLEMPNVKTYRRQRITCDEEDRLRRGYELSTHFSFSPLPGGQKRVIEATVNDDNGTPILRLVYAPTATLYRINHGWRNRSGGFSINLTSGEWSDRVVDPLEDDEYPVNTSSQNLAHLKLFVSDTQNILLVYFIDPEITRNEDFITTLQYALQRGIEMAFQVEESELIAERIGGGSHRAILFWEAAEGGVGVLRRIVEEPDVISQIAHLALERSHFRPDPLEDLGLDICPRACYECLLSYTNQRDHQRIDRHLVAKFLRQLRYSATYPKKSGKTYDEHYRYLRALTDSRSELERRFIDYLYNTKRRLPDDAQKPLKDYACIPDFFYEPNVCVFCDGSVHDEPEQKEKDRVTRQELKELGYRVVVIRYDRGLDEQVHQYKDIFGEGRN